MWAFNGRLYGEGLPCIMVVTAIGLQTLTILILLASFLIIAAVTAGRGLTILVGRELLNLPA